MKTIVILGDGMADYPIPELGHRTPMMVAEKPAMDSIARAGRTGRLKTIPDGMPTGSAVANLSVLGYDPKTTFQGRGVLEAASLGVRLSDEDLALRVNLVCIEAGKMRSHSSGHITNEKAGRLIRDLQNFFLNWNLKFTQGLSYRHLLVVPGGNPNIECMPPHDHLGEEFESLLVRPLRPDARETADLLNRMIHASQPFLADHPVNRDRLAQEKLPANSLWPWSPGKRPRMETFQKRFGIHGAAISAVDLIKGLAIYAGMDVISVEGATGLFDTNYEGKADACLKALENHDFVYVHVEAPDEAGHDRNMKLKIRCIEDLDRRLIQRILDGLGKWKGQTVIAVLPDHPTPIASGAHVRDPVPVAIWDPRAEPDSVQCFDEESVKKGILGLLHGDEFIRKVFGLDLK
jgi:2,3-bisphosphoglycerate-independent phosphoglycerate mutase